MIGRGCLVLVGFTIGVGCRPTLDDRPWLITEPRVVGWKADPPEANPGATVSVQAFAADPAGPADTSAAVWALCHEPKPIPENRPVAPGCLAPPGADAVGNPVELTIPTDACRVFGPDTPQPLPGAPPTRLRDADATGGYYQPILISFGAGEAVGLERIRCGLPDASLAVARAFQASYVANENPAIAGLSFSAGGAPVDPAAIPPGARIDVVATWPSGTAESFPAFDRGSHDLLAMTEVLGVSWYATGGEIGQPAARIADPSVLSAVTTWTAPPEPGVFEIVLVLRDSRGGSDATRSSLKVDR